MRGGGGGWELLGLGGLAGAWQRCRGIAWLLLGVPAGDAGMADGRKTGGALGAVIAIPMEVCERYEALIAVTGGVETQPRVLALTPYGDKIRTAGTDWMRRGRDFGGGRA